MIIFFIFFQLNQHGQLKMWSNYSCFKHQIQGPLEADNPEVVQILKRNYLNHPSPKPYNFSKNTLYTKGENAFSWPFIYFYTKQFFQNLTEGFFIEAGALDGEYLSNSLWLEKELNWTGLLIEPNPYNYKELLMKNRKAWTSNTCLSTKSYPKEVNFAALTRSYKGKKSLTWAYKGASYETEYTLSPLYNHFLSFSNANYIKAQCFPLYSYLLALERTKVDFLSLDIQGSERDVLSTIPFDKLDIQVIAVEYAVSSLYDEAFVKYFEDKGYVFIACGGESDYIFIKSNKVSQELKKIKENFINKTCLGY